MNILGISCFYHDSAACFIRDGDIVAAAQEERFSRKKQDPRFPRNAIDYCLKESGIAIQDLDYSARLQSVSKKDKPDYHGIISAFERLTGCAVIVNTSFNLRGEPIVCTPEDAYRCFMRTEMDVLVIENFILYKEEQPPWKEKGDWRDELELD